MTDADTAAGWRSRAHSLANDLEAGGFLHSQQWRAAVAATPGTCSYPATTPSPTTVAGHWSMGRTRRTMRTG